MGRGRGFLQWDRFSVSTKHHLLPPYLPPISSSSSFSLFFSSSSTPLTDPFLLMNICLQTGCLCSACTSTFSYARTQTHIHTLKKKPSQTHCSPTVLQAERGQTALDGSGDENEIDSPCEPAPFSSAVALQDVGARLDWAGLH